MEYSNGRNKLTANETSNKNASNDASFVFSAVSCFHWLLLADKKHNLPFSETFSFASHRLFPNALDCQQDDLWPTGHPITAVVFQQMRALCLQVWAEEIDLLFSKCILENPSVHWSCIRRVRAKSSWRVDIAVQCCQSWCFSNWEKKKILRRAYLGWHGSPGRFWFSPGEFMKSVCM